MITSHGKTKKLNSCPLPSFPLDLHAEFMHSPSARLLPAIHLIQAELPLESTHSNLKNNVLIHVIVQSLPDGEGDWSNILLPHRENKTPEKYVWLQRQSGSLEFLPTIYPPLLL